MNSLHRLQLWATTAAEAHASDVFLCEGEPLRVRIDGAVRPIKDGENVTREELEALWVTCQGSQSTGQHDLDAHWDSGDWRYRVNLHRHLGKLGSALRVIQTEIPRACPRNAFL